MAQKKIKDINETSKTFVLKCLIICQPLTTNTYPDEQKNKEMELGFLGMSVFLASLFTVTYF